jgi:glycosyltransferase involved in cell wall biosynthesis
MKSDTFVTVIVPCRNEKRYIEACLDSILANDYPKDKLEILVVDGMSDDKTRAIIERYAMSYAFIRLLDNPRKITPCALNIGIKNARGDIIIRADAHSKYARDYIKKCVEFLNKTGADSVGGPMRAVGTDYISNAIAFVHNSPFGLGGGKFHNEKWEGEVDTPYLECWPRRVFDKVGLFDERLIRNQDIEFDSRIRKSGGKLLLSPEIKSYYYCRSNLVSLVGQNFKNGLWSIKTIKITPGSLSLRHFVPLLFVLGLFTSWIIPPIWFAIIGSYILCSTYFSLRIGIKSGFKYIFIVSVIFLILHLSYGLGSLVGIFNAIKGDN